MEREFMVLLGFAGMFGLMALRVPVGIAMGVTGIFGFAAVSGWSPAINLLANVPLSVITDYNLSVIPMFVLMGAFASYGGMSRELYNAGRTWLGHFRGGLALASIFSCAGFAAINGSSVATTATMTQIALPEMRRGGYDAGLSAGMIAAGGTLGIMIPPSVIFVLYGIMTEIDITQLFAAGVFPGLIAVAFYSLIIVFLSYKYPHLLPRGTKHSWAERWASVRGLWAIFALFLMVLGGIYSGIFHCSGGRWCRCNRRPWHWYRASQARVGRNSRRLDSGLACVLGHYADRYRRLLVWLLPNNHTIYTACR